MGGQEINRGDKNENRKGNVPAGDAPELGRGVMERDLNEVIGG